MTSIPVRLTLAGKLKRPADWDARGVVVREGASLGARVVVVPGRVIGRWAMVAAGAVVTRDVADYALVAGVPARHIGWVGRAGERLLAEAPGRSRRPPDRRPVRPSATACSHPRARERCPAG